MDFTFPPSFAAGSAAAAGPAPQQMTAATFNSFLISAVANRLADHFERGVRFDDLTELCIHLARGIDYALTNNVVPVVAHRLPSLVKQVYLQRNGTSHQLESAVTLLMISFKNACKNGWFPATDTAELLSMANELCSSFCMTGSVTTEVSNVLDTISMIIPRFYPQLRLCRLITSFEAKPGYECLMADIDIQRNIPPGEQILLLVAQKDSIETSSCLISPPQVSFLVNGTGVERRNIVSLDTGPQFPTNITKMLKYGTNIIQAVGHFSGSYIIAIVSMMKSHRSAPVLNDYAQAPVAAFASDSEIIEGPSRISLNCPVSFRRIKTPVKGHLCKHHQCFDYDNFMEMNSRKPLWRCPCCNQSVSFIDLRIDQKMVKILGEVGDKTGEVIVSADGSWKIAEHNCSIDHLHDGNMECESNRSSCTQPNFVDLTMGEESVDSESDASMSYRKVKKLDGSSNRLDNDTCETEDRKPFKSDQSFPLIQISSEPLLPNCTAMVTQGEPLLTNCTTMVTQGASHQIVDDICPMTLLSTSASSGLSVSAASTATQRAGTLESLIPDFVLNPRITDVPPALDQEPIASNGASQPIFPLLNISQGQQLAEKMQLQYPQARSSIISNETEMPVMPRIPRNVNRAPAAVQIHPVQTQASNFSQRTLANVFNSSSNIQSCSPSVSYQSLPSLTAIQDGFNTLPTQNRDHHDRRYFLNPSQQAAGLPAPTQVSTRAPPDQQRGAGAYRASTQPSYHLNPHYPMLSCLAQQTMSQWTSTPPLSRDSSIHIQQPSGNAANISTESLVNLHNQVLYARHAASRTGSSFPTASDGFRPTGLELLPNLNYSAPRFDGISDLPSESSWRPTGRMRGSVTGSAYSAALGYYLARPAGQVPPIVPSTSDPRSVQFADSINGQRTLT